MATLLVAFPVFSDMSFAFCGNPLRSSILDDAIKREFFAKSIRIQLAGKDGYRYFNLLLMVNLCPKYDVAIIGAGHNGLVSACYLAKAGLSVLVLEKKFRIRRSHSLLSSFCGNGCPPIRLFLFGQPSPAKDRGRTRSRDRTAFPSDRFLHSNSRRRKPARAPPRQRWLRKPTWKHSLI